MKKIYLYILTTITLSIAFASCDKDLPFPIDEVKRSVVIDVKRVPGTDGVLSEGVTTGDYQIKLTIPTQQGDYSMMDHAQLLAVLNNGTTTTAQVVVDNITSFPSTQTINISDVYSKFGKTAPALGETLNFTVNVVLKSGEVIPGWDPYTKIFNNQAFLGWQIEGRSLSNRVQYSVMCPFVPEDFIGTFKCTETGLGNDVYDVVLSHHAEVPSTVPSDIDPSKLYGIKMDPISPNVWAPEAITSIVIWINTEDFSLYIPNQGTGDMYDPTHEIFWCDAKDTSISTCNNTIKFSVRPYMPGYGGWGYCVFSIAP